MDKILSEILNKFKTFEQVKAIAIGGSTRGQNILSDTERFDKMSDIDVYIFVTGDIDVQAREDIVKQYSTKYEVGGEYFGAGDEFWVDKMGKQLDFMYWNTSWFENVIHNVWEKHYPSNGYTTAFLFTLNNFEIVCDTDNWLKKLQYSIKTDYPKELKQNIITRNMMLIKDKPFSSYYDQIEKAIKRNDIVSINHRIAAFLASYFDILFAKNELLHPGEKRLIQYAKDNCKILPERFEENITALLKQPNPDTLKILDDMVGKIKAI